MENLKSFQVLMHLHVLGKREPPLMVLLAYARLADVSMECLVDDKMRLPD